MLSRRRVLPVVLPVVLVAGLLGLGVGLVTHERKPPAAPARATAAARESPAVATLRAWDGRRAEAWARGDASALRALYVPGSSAGAADVRLLRRWSARGLTVEGMRQQLFGARVLEQRPGRIRLVVTERLASASAGTPGSARLRLPVGRTRTREVVLRRTKGEWRVVSVRRSVPP